MLHYMNDSFPDHTMRKWFFKACCWQTCLYQWRDLFWQSFLGCKWGFHMENETKWLLWNV